MTSITYHTRLDSDAKVTIWAGSYQGTYDQETVERLASSFAVVIKPSGRAVFVDSADREVNLHIRVAPEDTRVGKTALAAARLDSEARRKKQRALENRLEALLEGMDTEEAIKRLEML